MKLRDELAMADACLAMVREDLEMFGMNMDGCPPMMYNDAVRSIVARLAHQAGLHTLDALRAFVRRPTSLVPREGA